MSVESLLLLPPIPRPIIVVSNLQVAYWALFKYPKSSGIQDGLGYLYSDANSPTPSLASDNLSTITNPFWRTLGKGNADRGAWMYGSTAPFNPLLFSFLRQITLSLIRYYNDETPEGKTTSSRAHAKGLLMAATDATGFWIVHSVPRFPLRNGTDFPDDELVYGQSFLYPQYNSCHLFS
jgi:hypothetical protein